MAPQVNVAQAQMLISRATASTFRPCVDARIERHKRATILEGGSSGGAGLEDMSFILFPFRSGFSSWRLDR